ncbi:YfiR family protein [Ginsengibacter hankyongi]|uniref:YfiR family protein n=1 Tax=Ginsengibacter hankyongi TaxID=2607284 RepID=A0A5J5IGJ3_9BACT|nr:YfiR family protein [Ginsengibacter hankyongi]KAA9036364.1 YfiR family protein [Ginsengibacter hankyongi]
MFKKIVYLITLCSAYSLCGVAQRGEEDYKLKAAFIYNFTKYIDWGNANSGAFSIGVIGNSPVYNSLQEIAKTKTVNNKRIVVFHFDDPDDIIPCHILFISANNSFSLSSVLARVSKGTLTISEEPGFADFGTAFNFFVDNHKLKFEANINTLNEEGMKASSQLLKLATIVK